MRTVSGAVKPGALDPGMDDPRILPGRDMRLPPEAAREEMSPISGLDLWKPGSDRGSGLFGNFELNRPARLFLNDGCAVSNPAASGVGVRTVPGTGPGGISGSLAHPTRWLNGMVSNDGSGASCEIRVVDAEGRL